MENIFEQLSSEMTHEEISEYLHSLKWEINEVDQEIDDEEIEDAEEYLRSLGYISLEESQQKISELIDNNNAKP